MICRFDMFRLLNDDSALVNEILLKNIYYIYLSNKLKISKLIKIEIKNK